MNGFASDFNNCQLSANTKSEFITPVIFLVRLEWTLFV